MNRISRLKPKQILTSTSRLLNRNLAGNDASWRAKPLGIIGLGSMGSKLVENYRLAGHTLLVHDVNSKSVDTAIAGGAEVSASIPAEMAEKCGVIVSILPNDEVLGAVTRELLASSSNSNHFVHVSCSTVSPNTSRALRAEYEQQGQTLVASPVFARPDGLAKKQVLSYKAI